MPVERKQIVKPYLLLCEGRDAEGFLINYLNSSALKQDKRFSSEIQVFDFGGNENLSNFLMALKNMDRFERIESLAIIRDAEKDYSKACREICDSLKNCGYSAPEQCGAWKCDITGLKIGFILFPLNNSAGTLEDLCLRILSEKNHKDILSSIDTFLDTMKSSYGRSLNRRHKNRLHTYLASSDKFVTMPLGLASKAGAFDWHSNELEPLKSFLIEGFEAED